MRSLPYHFLCGHKLDKAIKEPLKKLIRCPTVITEAIMRTFAFAAKSTSPSYQLDLALTWNRADIARTEIFTKDRKWKVWV